jgi:hypothetical protein
MVASTTKLGIGEFSIGLHVPLILAAWMTLPSARAPIRRRVTHVLSVGFVLLAAHFLLTEFTTPCAEFLPKSAASLVLMLLLALAVGQLATQPADTRLTFDLKVIVVLVTVSVVLQVVLGLTPQGAEVVRAGGIYSEPSHLALAFAPVLVGLMLAHERGDKIWGWCGFIVMTVLSASATLFVLVTLCFIMSLLARSRRQISLPLILRMILLIGFMAALVVNSPYGEEFANRMTGLTQNDAEANVSSLVYINGWETAAANLVDTYGIGLGFNRMGCAPRPETSSGEFLEFIGQGDLNYNDGSFVMSKLLSELGLLGLALWVLALWVLAQQVLVKTHRPMAKLPPEVAATVISGITVFTLGALIRGSSYLSGSFIFGLYCVLFARAQWQRAPRRRKERSLLGITPAAPAKGSGDAHHG